MTSDRKLLRSIRSLPVTAGTALIAKLRVLLSRQWMQRYAGWLLISIIAIQLLLSLPRLLWGSVWYDEFLTITTIRLPWRQIATGGYPKELHPPLYFLVLKGWTAVLGHTELAMRLLSLGLSCGSLCMLFLLVRHSIDLRAAFATALLFAIHPMYIYYATEIRMYALLIFCCLLALFAAWRYCTNPQVSLQVLLVLGIAVLAALYTHYFGILIALGIGILSVVRLILTRDRRPIAVLAVLFACAMIYLPSVYVILQRQMQEYRAAYTVSADQQLTWQVFPGLLSGSASLFFTRMLVLNSISLLAAAVGCLALWRNRHKSVVLTLILCISLSALLAFVASANGVNVVSRYMLHIGVLALILIGSTCMWQNGSRWWAGSGVLGIVVLGLYLYSGAEFALRSAQLHPNWRAVATVIRDVDQPDEPIVVLGWDASPIQFYLPDHLLLTSYDFEAELQKQPGRSSYLLVQSESGRSISLAKPTTELWQNPIDHISVVRYVR